MGAPKARNCCYCGTDLDHYAMFLGRDWCNKGSCARQGVARDETRRRQSQDAEGLARYPEVTSGIVGRLPANRGETSPLPDDRRSIFEEHLRSIVDAVLGGPLGPPSEAATGKLEERGGEQPISASPELVSAACALCRGHCCNLGGDTAFLDTSTIVRVIADEPEIERDRLLETYRHLLPERTFTGSCVYHGETGCTLPRTLRADICNRFHCRGLQVLSGDVEREGATDAVILSIDGREVVRHAAFAAPRVDLSPR
ncbi:MAG: hypothetical protein KDC38_06840 [Planctomycetes bacterium]|nr:hypothetical protein [Planctomycetota bacterium]